MRGPDPDLADPGKAPAGELFALPVDPGVGEEREGATDRETLDRSLVSGIAWTSAVKWSSQVVRWASTLVVARLLAPEDYGLVGMAALYLGLVTIVSEAGVGAAVVIRRELTARQIKELNTVSVLAGVFGFGLTALLSGPTGSFFNAPRLPPVLIFMGLTFLVSGFRVVPQAVLRKELRFKLLAVLDGIDAVAAALATVTLAWFGVGYWALVFGPLAGVCVWTIITFFYAPQSFGLPHFSLMRDALQLSKNILVNRLAWYAYSNADFLVIGKFLGQAALGTYTIGWSIANIPINKISSMVGNVAPAVFAAAQEDVAEMRRYLLLTTEGLALLTFPAIVGLGVVADDLILLAIGERWVDSIWPLRILAIYATFRSVAPFLTHVLNTVGDSRFAMRVSVFAAFVLPGAFYIASRWGPVGVAATWMLVHPLVTVPIARRVFLRLEMRTTQYLAALWPAFSSCALMVAAVLSARALLPAEAGIPIRLSVQVVVGAASYILSLALLHRERVRSARNTIALFRK